MGLTEYWKIIRRWWWLPVLGALLFATAGYTVSARQKPQYLASARLLVNQVQNPGPSSYNDLLTSEKLATTYTQLLQSPSLLDDTIVQVGLPITAETLRKRTSVSVVRATQLIELTVWDYDPGRAAATANGLARLFVKRAQDLQMNNTQGILQQVDHDLDTTQGQITDTSSRLNQIRANLDATGATTLEIQRLQQLLSQYDQDLRDIRTRSADDSSRLNTLKSTPDPDGTAQPEIQRLQMELAQYDQQMNDIRAHYTDTSSQLDKLRATPIAGSVAQGDAQHLQDQLTQYQTKYSHLLDTRQTIVIAQAQGAAAVTVTDPARIPSVPIAPTPRRNALLGGAIGLLLLAGLALLLDFRDDRIHDPAEAAQTFGVPLLGILGVSRGARPLLLTDTEMPNIEPFREALRHVRATMDAGLTAGAVIAISSARPGEGKSVVAANLALLEAQGGKRVLLIDADVRAPHVHKLLGMQNNQGLSAYLARTQHGNQPKFQEGPLGITVLTAGWALTHLPDLLGSARMVNMISDLRDQFDIILLDTAPVLSAADTLALQQAIDGTVLVMDARRTGTRMLERTIATLNGVYGKTLGIVLTKDRKRAGVYGSRAYRIIAEDERADDALTRTDLAESGNTGPVSLSA
jgi:capsular exopolysaccharide synthesis family protein